MTTETDTDPTLFSLTAEQLAFRDVVRAFLATTSPESEVRRVMEGEAGYDPGVWRAMADQLNLQGLVIPERYGGEGFGHAEQSIVLEEMGAALLPGPFFASAVLATSVLLHCGDESAKEQFLPDLAAGRSIATLAHTEHSGRWTEDGIATRAVRGGDAWELHGSKTYVLDGQVADLLLVTAHTDAGLALFAVDGANGPVRRALSTLDATRRQSAIDFSATPAQLIGENGAAWPDLQRALDVAAAGLAAEQVGGSARCLDQSVGYVKIRTQFGKPIGSFQAIRHKCADMLLDVECARGAAQYAARAADHFPDELPAAASLAKAFCSEVYARTAATNIQLHGGIGFTWDHPAHMYFKRARSSGHLLGDVTYHRGLLADRIGL